MEARRTGLQQEEFIGTRRGPHPFSERPTFSRNCTGNFMAGAEASKKRQHVTAASGIFPIGHKRGEKLSNQASSRTDLSDCPLVRRRLFSASTPHPMKLHYLLAAAFALLSLCGYSVEYQPTVFEGRRYTVCKVDLSMEKLELFLNDEAGVPFKRFATLEAWLAKRGRQIVFGMNAGMYHADYAPVGMYVSNGAQTTPVNLRTGEGNFFLKPNGVFLVTSSGAQVVEASRVATIREKIELATQSGPLLVLDGRLHPAFKLNSENRLFRNGVGVKTPKEVIFVNSEEPVNFHEFARLFRDQLGCPNALFLDGTISSLHAAELKRSDFKIDLGPIIGITVPAKPEGEGDTR